MAFLKVWLSLFSIMLVLVLQAQEYEDIRQAFRASYVMQADSNYIGGISELEKVYEEGSYEINVRMGWLYYLSGSYPEAASCYEKCIRLKPLSIEARLGYALTVSAMGNWTLAEERYEEILEIDPENSWVNYRMGLIHYNREDYQQAFWYFENVVNHYPFDYDSVIMLAWTAYQLGKQREAKVLFQKALLMKPDDNSAKEGLGLVN
jgi:tetratricopeptide (TPR) repeat protein